MRTFFTVLLLCSALVAGLPTFAADFDKGMDSYDKGDYKTALAEFHTLAEQGHAVAQYNLGLMYSKGNGVPQNYKAAMKWYAMAAEQGDALVTGASVATGMHTLNVAPANICATFAGA